MLAVFSLRGFNFHPSPSGSHPALFSMYRMLRNRRVIESM
jgi:hypothetical protein